MSVFWMWYRHWQRTIISSSEYSQTATGNVTQTSTVVTTAKIFAVRTIQFQNGVGDGDQKCTANILAILTAVDVCVTFPVAV